MKKHNFIWDIFLDYQKNKRDYCLWRWCTTCGNYKIRDQLFHKIIDELGIGFEKTNMKEGFLSLGNIRDRNLYNKMVDHLIKNLNDLSDSEIENILGPRPFYEEDKNQDDFMKFIIMEIYSSLRKWYQDREEVLDFLKLKLSNKKILRIVDEMNDRYQKHQLQSI